MSSKYTAIELNHVYENEAGSDPFELATLVLDARAELAKLRAYMRDVEAEDEKRGAERDALKAQLRDLTDTRKMNLDAWHKLAAELEELKQESELLKTENSRLWKGWLYGVDPQLATDKDGRDDEPENDDERRIQLTCAALQGLLAHYGHTGTQNPGVKSAVAYADAALEALKKS